MTRIFIAAAHGRWAFMVQREGREGVPLIAQWGKPRELGDPDLFCMELTALRKALQLKIFANGPCDICLFASSYVSHRFHKAIRNTGQAGRRSAQWAKVRELAQRHNIVIEPNPNSWSEMKDLLTFVRKLKAV